MSASVIVALRPQMPLINNLLLRLINNAQPVQGLLMVHLGRVLGQVGRVAVYARLVGLHILIFLILQSDLLLFIAILEVRIRNRLLGKQLHFLLAQFGSVG